jgi:cellulose synthase/poly-beta-1,6-N-acetylglucosamine synthase-like glycosyltransferase
MVKETFSIGWYVLGSLVVFVDLLDLLLRIYFRHVQTMPTARRRGAPTSVPLNVGEFTPYEMRLHLRPYALLVSVHNAGAEIETFLNAMRPYRSHLWVFDDASTDDTWSRLQGSGVHCLRGERNRKKPAAIKKLLSILPPEVVTVVVLDPDARIQDRGTGDISDLERVLFEFQRSGMAALCPRIAIEPSGLLAALQAFEYGLAFSLGRKGLADHTITSGIAMYRRDALERVLDAHSLSVYAEDLKNTLILLGQGERIYYDGRLVVLTEGKHDWQGWFSQRVGWFFGLIKVYAEHFRETLRRSSGRPLVFYHFVVYMGVFTLLLHVLKLLSFAVLAASFANGIDNALGLSWVPDVAATDPAYAGLAYLKYTLLALIALATSVGRGERRRLLPIVPVYFFYVLVHLAPITVGYLNWIVLRVWGRRLYRDHYQEEDSIRQHFEFEERRRKAS